MVKKNKIVAIVQARLTSTRFPNKVIKKIGKFTIIELVYKRLKLSKYLDDIVFTIPDNLENKNLELFLTKKKINYIKGSENNVASRYLKAAKKYNTNIIVRVTSDCPLVDPKILDKMIKIYSKSNIDYLTNIKDTTIENKKYYYPDGLDIEIFSIGSYKKSYHKINSKYDRGFTRYRFFVFKIDLSKNFKVFG